MGDSVGVDVGEGAKEKSCDVASVVFGEKSALREDVVGERASGANARYDVAL